MEFSLYSVEMKFTFVNISDSFAVIHLLCVLFSGRLKRVVYIDKIHLRNLLCTLKRLPRNWSAALSLNSTGAVSS